jgi:hypothetical protein
MPLKRPRISLDMTEAQREAFDHILAARETVESKSAGKSVKLTIRTFIHLILANEAERLNIDWPDNYPEHGGPR